MSAFGRLARRPKYICAIRKLIETLCFWRLARRQKALIKFASNSIRARFDKKVTLSEIPFGAPCKAPHYQNTASGRHARRQKDSASIGCLTARMYFGRLARRPKGLVKFADLGTVSALEISPPT